MTLAAKLVRAIAKRSEYRRDGTSIMRPRYWFHRLATARLRRLAGWLEGDDD